MKIAHLKIVVLVLFIVGVMQAQDISQSSNNNLDKLVPGELQQIGGRLGSRALLSAINDLAFITQLGYNNAAYITQSSGNGITANFASILQGKSGNNAKITQKGDGNINTITQLGSYNEATINIDGDNNTSNILQIGNKNYALQDINASNKNYNVIQLGNNNSFQRYDTGQSPKAYIVSQNGNGLHLIISHNSYRK